MDGLNCMVGMVGPALLDHFRANPLTYRELHVYIDDHRGRDGRVMNSFLHLCTTLSQCSVYWNLCLWYGMGMRIRMLMARSSMADDRGKEASRHL
jgi:hypothetical protein